MNAIERKEIISLKKDIEFLMEQIKSDVDMLLRIVEVKQ